MLEVGNVTRRHSRSIQAISVLCGVLAFAYAIAQEPVVQRYQGNGALNTRPFTVTQGWEVRWDAVGDVFQLYRYDAAGNLIDVAANQQGPGTGASYFPEPGTYYLQVNALGAWTVSVVHIPNVPTLISSTGTIYRGNGARNTRPFSAVGPWEIQWYASGDVFQVYLYDGNGSLVDVAANQLGAGSGASYQPRAGTYYLQVNALGTWTVRIVSMD